MDKGEDGRRIVSRFCSFHIKNLIFSLYNGIVNNLDDLVISDAASIVSGNSGVKTDLNVDKETTIEVNTMNDNSTKGVSGQRTIFTCICIIQNDFLNGRCLFMSQKTMKGCNLVYVKDKRTTVGKIEQDLMSNKSASVSEASFNPLAESDENTQKWKVVFDRSNPT